MKTRKLATLVVLLLYGQSVMGGRGTFFIGMGNESCAQFIAATEESPGLGKAMTRTAQNVKFYAEKRLFLEWAFGYISLTNLDSSEDVQITSDPAAIELWLKNYCNRNPTAEFSHAMASFVHEMNVKLTTSH